MLAVGVGLFLSACGDSAATTEGASGYVIDGSNVTNYTVIRSDYAEGDLVRCGMDVRYAFEEAGYDLEIGTDFYREGNDNYTIGEFEILVGETNRPETQEFLDGLQMWQYGYALVGQKLVIAGHDDAATRSAVEAFREYLAAEETFSFSAEDNYIYGEVKEGTGTLYSLLTYNFGAGSVDDAKVAEAAADVTAYAPDLVIVQNAYGDTADKLSAQLSGYELGADYKTTTKHNLIYYNTATYTYSSAGHLVMSQMPMLTDAEKGSFTYCVLRAADTKEKYVFCATDLSGVPEDALKNRLEVFGDFSENTGKLPVLFSGIFDGAVDSPACAALTEYGYADGVRLAREAEGECTDNYLYASYDSIAVAKSVVTEHGLYAEFQRAE